jgi:nucleoside-diphosphate-sugar epimerase
MDYINIAEYIEDLKFCLSQIKSCESFLTGKTILITGTTGLIGSFLADVFIQYNRTHNNKINIISISRNEERTKERFSYIKKNDGIVFIYQDISETLNYPFTKIDFIIHAASNSDPKSFADEPIATIAANTIGTVNLLELAKKYNSKMVFLSSREVYGLVPGKTIYAEHDYGLIDFNQLRSAYPESKRAGELLCKSYYDEYKTGVSIARLGYVYGPSITSTDSKVIAQFFHNAVNGKDIILKSKGEQRRTYIYLADAVNGILHILFGMDTAGEVYNIGNSHSVISISNLADLVAETGNVKKVMELPDSEETKSWSPEQDVMLDYSKLEQLGWFPSTGIETGIKKTFAILKKVRHG